MAEETETQEQETQEQAPVKTAAEIAAEKRADEAEKRAQEKEAEAEQLRVEVAKSKPGKPAGYTLGSFTEAEWTEAEGLYGIDRKQILTNLNLKAQTEGRIDSATAKMEAKMNFQETRASMAADDPLYPKYRKEVENFLADIPDEVKLSDPKKWLAKAFDYGKKSVKLPATTRKPDNMDTRETGTVKEKGAASEEMSEGEREVLQSHGKTPEDYKKLKHPFLTDGIMLKDRPEEPKFGPR